MTMPDDIETGPSVAIDWISTGPSIPIGEPAPGPGGGGGYHRHTQTTPASVVTIVHGLGRWPAAVMLTSLDGSITYTEFGVQYVDLDTVRISIDTPTAYEALIS